MSSSRLPRRTSQAHQRPRWANRAVSLTGLCLAVLVALVAGVAPTSAADVTSHHQHRAQHRARAHAQRAASGPLGQHQQSQRRAPTGAFASSGFDYINQKARGVNLGNWLVLEPWMDPNASQVLNARAVNAPSSTAVVDEYTMGTYVDADFMRSFFTQHFDTWITQDDFRQIAAAGLNHVRIPIGHWAFADCIEPDAPYQALNRFDKLKQGVMWAKQYGLKVWIDLHGTPGSQNGYPGSGRAGAARWPADSNYYTLTQKAFNYLVAEFTKSEYQGTVTGIQPVNEPIGQQQRTVQNLLNVYYPWSWDALAYPNGTSQPPSSVMLVTHDAWQGLSYWQRWWNSTQSERVIMDAHPYFVYGPQETNSVDSFRLNEVCEYGARINSSQNYHPTVAGEWTIGAPKGDNFPNLRDLLNTTALTSGPTPPFSQKYMQFLAVNFRAQQQIYELGGSGWMFWNWKHKAFADQSYQTGVRYGWLPANASQLDEQPFGSLCRGTQFYFSGVPYGSASGGGGAGGTGGAGASVVGLSSAAKVLAMAGSVLAASALLLLV